MINHINLFILIQYNYIMKKGGGLAGFLINSYKIIKNN